MVNIIVFAKDKYIYKYIGRVSPFKLTPKETSTDLSIEGLFQAKYCSYRLRYLTGKRNKLLDLVKKEKQFTGAFYPNPYFLDN